MGCCASKPKHAQLRDEEVSGSLRTNDGCVAATELQSVEHAGKTPARARNVPDVSIRVESLAFNGVQVYPEVTNVESDLDYTYQWQLARHLTEQWVPAMPETYHAAAFVPSIDDLNHYVRLRVTCLHNSKSFYSNAALVCVAPRLRPALLTNLLAFEASFACVASADLRCDGHPYICARMTPTEFKLKSLRGGPSAKPGPTIPRGKFSWEAHSLSTSIAASPMDDTSVTIHFGPRAISLSTVHASEREVLIATFRAYQALASPHAASLVGDAVVQRWRKSDKRTPLRQALTQPASTPLMLPPAPTTPLVCFFACFHCACMGRFLFTAVCPPSHRLCAGPATRPGCRTELVIGF